MSCSILAMKQDKIIMLLNVKRIMFVNMFYFSSLLFYLEIKTESVPATTDIFLHFVRHENNFMRPENIGFDFFRNFAPSNDN